MLSVNLGRGVFVKPKFIKRNDIRQLNSSLQVKALSKDAVNALNEQVTERNRERNVHFLYFVQRKPNQNHYICNIH